jgi:Tol biopolymer transport system component
MKRIGLVVTAALAATVVAVTSALAGSPPVQLAYVKDTASSATTTIWVATGTGADQRELGTGSQPLLSPNGAFVAAENFGGVYQLKVFSVSGGVRYLSKNLSATPLAWSPNSQYLVVAVMSNSSNGAGSYLAVVNTATWTVAKIANGVVGGASFSPSGGQIAYSVWPDAYTLKSNIYTINLNGSGNTQITFGHDSLSPIWGAKGIVFTREGCSPGSLDGKPIRCEGDTRYYDGQPYGPSGQLWLKSGSQLTQLTHVPVNLLVFGLTPVGVSANGNRILAAFGGEDTDYSVAVQISPRIVHTVNVGEQYAVPGAISRNGDTLLIAYGSFEQAADTGTVDTVPFLGSQLTKLARGAWPTWDK